MKHVDPVRFIHVLHETTYVGFARTCHRPWNEQIDIRMVHWVLGPLSFRAPLILRVIPRSAVHQPEVIGHAPVGSKSHLFFSQILVV